MEVVVMGSGSGEGVENLPPLGLFMQSEVWRWGGGGEGRVGGGEGEWEVEREGGR